MYNKNCPRHNRTAPVKYSNLTFLPARQYIHYFLNPVQQIYFILLNKLKKYLNKLYMIMKLYILSFKNQDFNYFIYNSLIYIDYDISS